jgi:hypothetical protein
MHKTFDIDAEVVATGIAIDRQLWIGRSRKFFRDSDSFS